VCLLLQDLLQSCAPGHSAAAVQRGFWGPPIHNMGLRGRLGEDPNTWKHFGPHSVAARLSVSPVCSTTAANGCEVEVFLLNGGQMKIYESTALARQMPTGADVAAVRLNVAAPAGQPVAEGSALALRLQLQDQLQNVLNVSGPVTMRRTLSSVRDSAR
jgi:hypothetical protein